MQQFSHCSFLKNESLLSKAKANMQLTAGKQLLVVEIFAYAIIVLDGKHHHVMQCSDE
jgi:hypothetical protein